MFRLFKAFLKRTGWLYIPGIALMILSGRLQILVPRLLGEVVDRLRLAAEGGSREAVLRGLLSMLLAAAAAFASRFLWRWIIMGNSRHLETGMRRHLLAHLTEMPVSWFQKQKTGDLMAHAINDIGAVRQTFGPGLALTVNAVTLGILAITGIATLLRSWLTVCVLLPVPVVLFLIFRLGGVVRRRFLRVQEAFSSLSDRMQESISGISVLKAYGQEREEAALFDGLNRRSRDAHLALNRASSLMSPSVTLLFGISFSLGIIFGGRMVLEGRLTLGEFVAFTGYLSFIVSPVQSVARIINLLQRGLASWKRLRVILDAAPAVKDAADAIPESELPARAEGRLEMDAVSFRHGREPRGSDAGRKDCAESVEPSDCAESVEPSDCADGVESSDCADGVERSDGTWGRSIAPTAGVRNISLSLAPGRRIGILGRTGSGKTTLANLLSRLHDVDSGCIRLDGVDIRRLPVAWLRRQIAVVPQDQFLFSATIADNIRFFDDSVPMAEVERAARIADLHGTVAGFPQGYETVTGERGVRLSGGQRQRVGLARALVANAPVLVIDDTLSAVDTLTESRILASLDAELRSRACLIIANRVSALRACDEILVLDDGAVAERGTHEQLLALGGIYAEIASLQEDRAG